MFKSIRRKLFIFIRVFYRPAESLSELQTGQVRIRYTDLQSSQIYVYTCTPDTINRALGEILRYKFTVLSITISIGHVTGLLKSLKSAPFTQQPPKPDNLVNVDL
jgi:hypothetical protein